MPTKLTSLASVAVAVCGATLAVFIPTASAEQTHASGVYCQNGTYIQYTQYNQCPPGTTTATSTTTTASTTPAPTYDGHSFANSSDLVVGETLAPGVVVIAKLFGETAIDDKGTVFVVNAGSQLSVSSDGTALITKSTSTSVTTDVILPAGQSLNELTDHLPYGASYGGTGTTESGIGKLFGIYSTNSISNLRVAHGLFRTRFAVVGTGKNRSSATLKFSKSLRAFQLYENLRGVKYTSSRYKYYRTHRTLSGTVTFTTNTKKSHAFHFTYPF